MPKCNESNLERIVRFILAIGTGYLAYNTIPELPRIILGILTIILLMSSITGFCGLYAVLGMNTCPIKIKKAKTEKKSKATKKKK